MPRPKNENLQRILVCRATLRRPDGGDLQGHSVAACLKLATTRFSQKFPLYFWYFFVSLTLQR